MVFSGRLLTVGKIEKGELEVLRWVQIFFRKRNPKMRFAVFLIRVCVYDLFVLLSSHKPRFSMGRVALCNWKGIHIMIFHSYPFSFPTNEREM